MADIDRFTYAKKLLRGAMGTYDNIPPGYLREHPGLQASIAAAIYLELLVERAVVWDGSGNVKNVTAP